MSELEDLEAAIFRTAEHVSKSVVGIGARVRGTGFVLEPGRIVTNAHNLRGETVTVHVAGEARRGEVLGVDPDGDLAVVSVETATAPPLAVGEAGARVGRVVIGLAALPAGGVRVTAGTISAVERSFRGPRGRLIAGSIEHTAPLAPGSSGGPLVDADGRLVGINTNRVGDGFYLAIPAGDALAARLAALARGESVRRPVLGVAVAPAFVARRLRRSVGLPERDGVLVRGVEEGSPADRAGIREGDLIVALAGRAVSDADELHAALDGASFPVEIVVVRGTEERTVTVGSAEESESGAGTDGTPGGANGGGR